MIRNYKAYDEDFERYKARGGSMTRAEFFNNVYGMGSGLTDSGFLHRRIADSLGVEDEAPAKTLEGRILAHLSMTG